MSESNRQRVRRIFMDVAELSSAERTVALAHACGENAKLRADVDALLRAYERAGDFFAAPTRDRRAFDLDDPHATRDASGARDIDAGSSAGGGVAHPRSADRFDESPGVRIGPYKLLQRIGEGGFGSVWMAEQREPMERRVALKIIKAGMDTREVVARFAQERQALALMNHPNIAKVFDAGVTEMGRPYFVMELCKGESISAYCDQHRLSIHERLALFAQVCSAVQHAHGKGVIHRDIKPNNVLVFTQDGRPHAKVIDFGIAKAIDTRLTDQTLFTEHRQLIGTPAYMSPEQADGNLDIDTRSDVYSLGVMLYELLTGDTPFNSRQLLSAAFGEMQRIIREVDPPRPSTRLSESANMLGVIAARRRTAPRRLGFLLRGELDWIVMKSLEKNRARRYESASALADDVQRFLAGQPVVAAPPGRGYLFRKFVRRHKGVAATGIAVVAALATGAIAFAWQAQLARTERDRAVLAEARARQRAADLQQVSDFQSQMLAQVDPTATGQKLSTDVQVALEAALNEVEMPDKERDALLDEFSSSWSRINATDAALSLIKISILKPALAAIDSRFANQPALGARLRAAIGQRYLDLGLVDDARRITEEALAMRRETLGEDDPDTIGTLLATCKMLNSCGRGLQSEVLLRALLERQRTRLGDENPQILFALDLLGESLYGQGRFQEAEPLLREALAGRRKVLGEDDIFTLATMGNLALTLRGMGELAESEEISLDALHRRERIWGVEHPYTLGSYNNLATVYLEQGRVDEAIEFFRKSAETRRRVLGEGHRDTIVTTNNLAAALGRAGRHGEALAIQREMLGRTRKALGPDHPDSLAALSNLGTTLINTGKYDEAEPYCRESLDRRLRLFGRNHAQTLIGLNVMGFLLRRQQKPAEAEVYLRQAFDVSATVLGADHPERIVLLLNMGTLAADLGRNDEAIGWMREALERATRKLGANHPHALSALQSLGEYLLSAGEFSDVVALLSNAEPRIRQLHARKDNGDLRILLLRLGLARVALHDFAAAESNLLECYPLYVAARVPSGKRTLECAQGLVDLYDAWNAVDADGDYAEKAAEWRTRLIVPESQPTSGTP